MKCKTHPQRDGDSRQGSISVFSAFAIIALIGFVSLGVDVGYIAYEKQRMQIAVDAAALAAAMEITNAIENAPEGTEDVNQYACEQAKLMAEDIAQRNGQYIDPNLDVETGRRTFNETSGEFEITWGASPANVLKVRCRRDNPDASSPNARVPTFFAHVLGNDAPNLVAESIATVESRDIVSVLDFSRSMNFDSYFNSEASTLPSESQIEANLQKVWDDLGNPSYGNMPFVPGWVTIPSAYWGDDLVVRWESERVYVDCDSNLQKVKSVLQRRWIHRLSPRAVTLASGKVPVARVESVSRKSRFAAGRTRGRLLTSTATARSNVDLDSPTFPILGLRAVGITTSGWLVIHQGLTTMCRSTTTAIDASLAS